MAQLKCLTFVWNKWINFNTNLEMHRLRAQTSQERRRWRAWDTVGILQAHAAPVALGLLHAVLEKGQDLRVGLTCTRVKRVKSVGFEEAGYVGVDVKVIKCRFQYKRAQRYIELQLFPSTLK